MSGSVELDPDGSNLLIRFAYREDLVALVKELPGRRWDPKGKVWRVPTALAERVFEVFSRHLFDFAPEVPSLIAGTFGTRASADAAEPTARRTQRSLPMPTSTDPATAASANDATTPALTISALNRRVRDGLREQFPSSLWVTGEVVDFDKSAGRQHRFFQLVEKAKGQPRATAAVEVALFAATAERLLPRLLEGDTPLSLRDGIEIRVLVRVDLYQATGRFQIVIEDIDPSFTLGKLALTREQILRELAQKGLADRNRSLGFVVPTLRIAVLASPDSDGFHDFVTHLTESKVGFGVTLVPIKVQGVELKPSVLQALAFLARNETHFDVVCILRGGGSRTDLAWFDDRDLAFAVARHPLKILVGIGHQRDQSVLDAIAHSEKTPTAIAQLLVRLATEVRADVQDRAERLVTMVGELLQRERTSLDRTARELRRAVTSRLLQQRAHVAAAGREIQAAVRLRLQREHSALHHATVRTTNGARRRVERATARLDQHATRLRLLDPARVLGRGYALVRDAAGRVVPAAARLDEGQAVRLQFRDGTAAAHIDQLHRDPPTSS